MGQPVAVRRIASADPRLLRFELNRALTGQGHERFASPSQAVGPRPAAELARRLFATGAAETIHVMSNVVTVRLAPGASGDAITPVLERLYEYWKPGMTPTVSAS
ncbi:MAG: hypothetical protein ACO26C_01670 [Ilumatobacteraceae bacterium]